MDGAKCSPDQTLQRLTDDLIRWIRMADGDRNAVAMLTIADYEWMIFEIMASKKL